MAAVKKVDERLSEELKLPLTTAFSAVYGVGFSFDWGCSACGGALAYTYSDHIDFQGFFASWRYNYPDVNVRLVVHELGHAFDQRVCIALHGNCNDDVRNGPVRTKLTEDIGKFSYLKRNDYGTANDTPPYNGFAGDKDDWQFSIDEQKHFAGEIWADMYLGWVYQNLAQDRRNYMNAEMKNYLELFR